MIHQYHLYLSGDVRGVGLRYSFREKAESLNLIGWIKNLADGRVEIVIQGEEENIKEIINWSKDYTSIDNIEIKKEIPQTFKRFEIRY